MFSFPNTAQSTRSYLKTRDDFIHTDRTGDNIPAPSIRSFATEHKKINICSKTFISYMESKYNTSANASDVENIATDFHGP